jgi:hypothetical protein
MKLNELKEIIKEEYNKILNEATLYHGTTADVKFPLDSSKTKDKNLWLAKTKEDAIMAAMKKGVAKKRSDIVIHHVKPKGLEITPKGDAIVVKGTIGKGNISKTDKLV